MPVRADERCAYAALEAVERLLDGPTTAAPETTGEDSFEALAAGWAEQKAECEHLSKACGEALDRLPQWARDDTGPKRRFNQKTGFMEHDRSEPRLKLEARIKRANDDCGITELEAQSDAAYKRLGEIEKRISETPTTTLFGIVTKLRVEASMEVEYEFWTTEHMVKTALAGAEYLLAQSRKAA